MAASPWKQYITRSLEHLKDRSTQVLRASPTPIHGNVLPLLSFKSQDDLKGFATGCDADLGGKSTCTLDLAPTGDYARFYGRLSNDLNPGRRKEGVVERGGYAGFRNKQRTTFFGTLTWDTSLHDYLRLRVRSSGDGMRYFVNIQTEGPVRSDLFQHRLWLPSPSSSSPSPSSSFPSPSPSPPSSPSSSSSPSSFPAQSADPHPHAWTDILIPFSDFTLTNSGDLSGQQVGMLRDKVRTVGVSVLGPMEGRFELSIASIDAVSLDPSQQQHE